jgi:glycosyltransferase involved in cell wall biosynthesis
MYCGNCFRDNALVAELRRLGHEVLLLPMYLPLTLDEPDESVGTPVFFGGINVYLEQKLSVFRKAPNWLRHWLASPALLRWATGRAAKTRPEEVGELTLSMLRGEEGNQARELEELIRWLRTQPRPDVVCLSNALLVGLARRLKQELGTRVVCLLSGEDTFLDGLPAKHRDAAWQTLADRAIDVDFFVAPSRYFADLMVRRLGLSRIRLEVIPGGVKLEGYDQAESASGGPTPSDSQPTAGARPFPVLGYFARMSREKGLDQLVEAYLLLRRRNRVPDLQLRIGGSCGPGDEPLVASLRAKLAAAGVLGDVEFHPNLDRAAKVAFLRSLSVFSVPALYGEAFGLYLIEAMAAGVPVVQPRHAAFPEILEATHGGVLCEPGHPEALAAAIEDLLLDPERARRLGEAGRHAVFETFNIGRMAERLVAACQQSVSH